MQVAAVMEDFLHVLPSIVCSRASRGFPRSAKLTHCKAEWSTGVHAAGASLTGTSGYAQSYAAALASTVTGAGGAAGANAVAAVFSSSVARMLNSQTDCS